MPQYNLMNETVDATGQANGQGGTVVRRYTNPPPTPDVPTPATPAPATGDSSAPTVLTQDQFNANRTGGVDENAIREANRKNMQATIDAIDAEYANLISSQQKTNESNLGQTRAVNARSGLMGSDFGNANTAGQQQANDKAVQAIRDEQAVKIAGVNSQINKDTQDEIAAKKAEALGNADAYSKYLDQAQTKAQGYISSLGQSGTTVSDLKTQSPDTYAYLQKTLGMSDFQLQNALNVAAGQNVKTDTKILGDTAYASTYNPVTGKFETHVQQFNLPDGSLVDFGNGKIMEKIVDPQTGEVTYKDALPKEQALPASAQEYEYAKSQGYTGSYNDYQNMDANRKKAVSNTYINQAGLNPYQQFQGTLDIQKSLQANTKAAQTIQNNYKNMQSAYDRLDSGQTKDLNAVTQVIITDFNKINDPSSVVRESEYARTPEGQSFLATLEGKYNALANGGPGLTKESLKEFVDLASQLSKNAQEYSSTQNAQAIATAKKFGLDTSLIGNQQDTPSDANLSDEDAYKLYLQSQGGGN